MPSHQPASGYPAKVPEYMSPENTAGRMAKPTEPGIRNKHYDPAKKHITELPITLTSFYQHVNWYLRLRSLFRRVY